MSYRYKIIIFIKINTNTCFFYKLPIRGKSAHLNWGQSALTALITI